MKYKIQVLIIILLACICSTIKADEKVTQNDQLKALALLKNQGLLSEEEYNKKKAIILDNNIPFKNQLNALELLKKQGIISEKEFADKKALLLNSYNAVELAEEAGDASVAINKTASDSDTEIKEIEDKLEALMEDKQFDEAAPLAQKLIEDYPESGIGWLHSGYIKFREKDYKTSLEYSQKARDNFEKSNDLLHLSRALKNIGLSTYDADNENGKESAISSYKKAYSISKSINDRIGMAYVANNIACIYLDNEDYDNAEKLFKTAMELYPKKRLLYLQNIAAVKQTQNNYEEAIKTRKEIAKIAQEENNPSVCAEALYFIGSNYNEEKKYNEAISYYLKALQIYNDLSNDEYIKKCLFYIGANYDELEQFDKSYEYYKLGAEKGDVDSMNNLAWALWDGEGCLKTPELAVEWFKKAANLGNTGSMFGLARCYDEGYGIVPDRQLAGKWFRKAARLGDQQSISWANQRGYDLTITEEEDEKMENSSDDTGSFDIMEDLRNSQIEDYNKYGIIYAKAESLLSNKKYQEASDMYKQAAEYWEKRDELQKQGYCLYSQGYCLNQISDYNNALHSLNKASELLLQTEDYENLPYCLYQLGECVFFLKEYSRAASVYEAAILVFQKYSTGTSTEVDCCVGAAYSYYYQDNFNMGDKLCEQAIAACDAIPGLIITRYIGRAEPGYLHAHFARPDYNPNGNWNDAIRLFDQGIEYTYIDDELQLPYYKAKCLFEKAECYYTDSNPEGDDIKSAELFGEAADIFESLDNNTEQCLNSLMGQACSYANCSDFQKVCDSLSRALKIAEEHDEGEYIKSIKELLANYRELL